MKKRLMKIAKQILRRRLVFKMRRNIVFSPYDYQRYLLLMSQQRGYAEGTGNLFRQEEQLPDADTLLYHIKKYKPYEISNLFDKITDQIIKIGRRNDKFRRSTPVTMAVDFTEYPYYGPLDGHTITKVSKEGSTKYCYKYVAISIVENGIKFLVKMLPIYYEENRTETVKKVILFAKKRFNIRIILFDRGFYGSPLMQFLDAEGLKFCIFVPRNTAMKKAIFGIKQLDLPVPYTYTHKIRKTDYKHIMHIVRGKEELVPVATNSSMKPEKLLNLYSQRWNIETGFRVLKDFKPKTTSRNMSVRLFNQLFAQTLYNLWVLVKLIGDILYRSCDVQTLEFKYTILRDYLDIENSDLA